MYRPGHLSRQQPKLLQGACTPHGLLDLAWRRVSGQSQKINVQAYAEGLVLIDLLAGVSSLNPLALIVEVSRDCQRWADVAPLQHFYALGYMQMPVSNLGAFLRVSYIVVEPIQFSVEFLGKQFLAAPATRPA